MVSFKIDVKFKFRVEKGIVFCLVMIKMQGLRKAVPIYQPFVFHTGHPLPFRQYYPFT